MLKIKLLAAATTAALFAVGGAVAQTSTSGSGTSASGTASGAADAGAQRGYPTTTTGRPEVGGSKSAGERATSGSTSSSAGATSSRAAAPSFSQIDKNNDGQISREEWNAYERTTRPAAGIRSDKQPSATTGPRDVGGSDRTKNPGPAAGTTGSRSGSTGAAAGSTGAAAGSTGAAPSTDKAPTTTTGPKESGGTGSSTK